MKKKGKGGPFSARLEKSNFPRGLKKFLLEFCERDTGGRLGLGALLLFAAAQEGKRKRKSLSLEKGQWYQPAPSISSAEGRKKKRGRNA